MRTVLALAVVMLSACASAPPPVPPAYTFRILDEPENRRFVFEFVSHDDRALCISADEWMVVSDNGDLGNAQPLQTARGEIKARTGYSTDNGLLCGRIKHPDCGTFRIEPHQSERTDIAYSHYGDPDVLALDKAKYFKLRPNYPFARVCKAKA